MLQSITSTNDIMKRPGNWCALFFDILNASKPIHSYCSLPSTFYVINENLLSFQMFQTTNYSCNATHKMFKSEKLTLSCCAYEWIPFNSIQIINFRHFFNESSVYFDMLFFFHLIWPKWIHNSNGKFIVYRHLCITLKWQCNYVEERENIKYLTFTWFYRQSSSLYIKNGMYLKWA